MSRKISSFWLVCALSLALFHSPLSGQKKDPSVFKLEFSGGTLTQYVQLIQTKPNLNNEGEQEMLNLVVLPSAANIEIPPINIETNSTGAVGLLNGYQTLTATLKVESDPSGNLRRIRAEYHNGFGVEVINCKQLLNSDSAMSDLLEAVEIGLKMAGAKAEMKLHKKTGLLFIKGTNAATTLVKKTVQQYASGKNIQLPGGALKGLQRRSGSQGGAEAGQKKRDPNPEVSVESSFESKRSK